MSFTSFNFFAFVALSVIVYFFCVPKKYQWYVLLAVSYTFYALAGGVFLFTYLLFTTTTVYICALWIDKIHNKPKNKKQNGSRSFKTSAKSVVALAAISNFGVLAFFKWYNTIADAANGLISNHTASLFHFPLNSLLLPLGISFYTFQSIGYLIDVYRKQLKPETNFLRFALFVSFFPQLVQGPISRHSELAEQLYASRRFNYEEARRGFQLIIWGAFKKLVIADRLIMMTSEIFATPEKYNGLYVLFGLTALTIRTYADFSGGIDVARGVAQIFGITMPLNFRRPFFANSLPDFWRRWHMSLNFWWRDYLFYPLVLSKPISKIGRLVRKHISPSLGKIIGVYICINIVRITNALWHGADLYFLANGLYNGILIVLGMACAPAFKKITDTLRINTECFSYRLFQILRTFLLVVLVRAFAAYSGVASGIQAIFSIVRDFNPWILNYDSAFLTGMTRWDARIVIVSIIIMISVEVMQERGLSIRETLERQNIAFQWAILLGGIFAVLLWGCYGLGYDAQSFAYQGF